MNIKVTKILKILVSLVMIGSMSLAVVAATNPDVNFDIRNWAKEKGNKPKCGKEQILIGGKCVYKEQAEKNKTGNFTNVAATNNNGQTVILNTPVPTKKPTEQAVNPNQPEAAVKMVCEMEGCTWKNNKCTCPYATVAPTQIPTPTKDNKKNNDAEKNICLMDQNCSWNNDICTCPTQQPYSTNPAKCGTLRCKTDEEETRIYSDTCMCQKKIVPTATPSVVPTQSTTGVCTTISCKPDQDKKIIGGSICQCIDKPKCNGTCSWGVSCDSLGKQTGTGYCQSGAYCCTDQKIVDLCMLGNSICVGSDRVKVCKADKSGYTESNCAVGTKCDSSVGRCVLTPTATPIVTSTPTPTTSPTPTSAKLNNGSRCSANAQCQSGNCVTSPYGTYCAAGTAVECTTGQTSCKTESGVGYVYKCNQNGMLVKTERCDGGCENGACKANVCKSNEVRCKSDTEIEKCNTAGTAWVASSCGSNTSCSESEKRCVGAAPATNVWTNIWETLTDTESLGEIGAPTGLGSGAAPVVSLPESAVTSEEGFEEYAKASTEGVVTGIITGGTVLTGAGAIGGTANAASGIWTLAGGNVASLPTAGLVYATTQVNTGVAGLIMGGLTGANLLDDGLTTAGCAMGNQDACAAIIPAMINPIPGAGLADDVTETFDIFKSIGNQMDNFGRLVRQSQDNLALMKAKSPNPDGIMDNVYFDGDIPGVPSGYQLLGQYSQQYNPNIFINPDEAKVLKVYPQKELAGLEPFSQLQQKYYQQLNGVDPWVSYTPGPVTDRPSFYQNFQPGMPIGDFLDSGGKLETTAIENAVARLNQLHEAEKALTGSVTIHGDLVRPQNTYYADPYAGLHKNNILVNTLPDGTQEINLIDFAGANGIAPSAFMFNPASMQNAELVDLEMQLLYESLMTVKDGVVAR